LDDLSVLWRKRQKLSAGGRPTLSGMMIEHRESHAVSALKRKRAEIAGLIVDHERRVREWRAALAHVDATLKLFDDTLDPEVIRPKRVHRKTQYFDGPELARLIQDELRKADGTPLTTLALLDAAIRAGDVPSQPHIRVTLKERIIKYLNLKAEEGLIVRVGLSHKAAWILPEVPQSESPEDGEPLS